MIDYVSGKPKQATPEEKVRQEFLKCLHEEHGYPKEHIDTEISVKMGSNKKRVDICVYQNADRTTNDIIGVIEVKRKGELLNEANKQLRSYMSALSCCRWGVSTNGNDNSYFRREGDKIVQARAFPSYLDEYTYIKEKHLKELKQENVKYIDKKFREILRIHAISDKPNAFVVFLHLLLCKIYDERGNKSIHGLRDSQKGLWFQHIEGIDKNESMLLRLCDLYKKASKEYLGKNIIDYDREDVEKLLENEDENNKKNDRIKKIIEDLRLKKNNAFSFIEVYDDITFSQNASIVKEVISLLQGYRFRYNKRNQFLGQFFETLLSISLKQDEGQFFYTHAIGRFYYRGIAYKRSHI